MNKLMEVFLSFTRKSYPPWYKILSMIPGSIVFLALSPLVLFFISRYISDFLPVSVPRSIEITLAAVAVFTALILMTWGFIALWFDGQGTPAPITPTKQLVTTGPYTFCRNPVELGTDLYFFSLGAWFDTLTTGILCMSMGMLLGYGYIKSVEERELKIRFGKKYEQYLARTPLFIPCLFCKGK